MPTVIWPGLSRHGARQRAKAGKQCLKDEGPGDARAFRSILVVRFGVIRLARGRVTGQIDQRVGPVRVIRQGMAAPALGRWLFLV
jgi:hypothetical protein